MILPSYNITYPNQSKHRKMENLFTVPESQSQAIQELGSLITYNYNDLNSFQEEEVTIWGVPLLFDERSELIRLRFLKATDFHVMSAYSMIKNTFRWRKEVDIDTLLEENLGHHYDKVLFTHGFDKEGYPVWYLVLGELLNSMLSETSFSDEENQQKFYCWVIQFVEKNIRKFGFSTTGERNSFVLVIDLEISSWHGKRDLYKVIYKIIQLLHDHYPDFLEKQIWINASWWYRYYCRVYCLVFDKWSTKKTTVFTGATKAIDTLFKYISPSQLPVKYGGLSTKGGIESRRFDIEEPNYEASISPYSKHTLDFNFTEMCEVVWDLRVIGWDIGYEAVFKPIKQGRYITIISRLRKLTPTAAPIISDSFSVTEPGKLVITIHNMSSKKKKKLVANVRVISPGGIKVGNEASLRGWLAEPNESCSD